MPWIPVHKNLADEHTLADGPPKWIENRCLEYCYTKLGRQTYFGWWTPQSIKKRCLEYCYTTLGRWTYFGWWTPQLREHRCLEYQYTKLGRQTYFGRWIPQLIEHRCLEYLYTKTWQMNILWKMDPPSQSRRDALNTATPILADKPTLADRPPN